MRWYIPERAPYPTWSYVAMTVGGVAVSYLTAMVVDVEREKTRRRQWFAAARRTSSSQYNRPPGLLGSLSSWWKNIRESDRTILSLMAVNGAVFLAWRVPSLSTFMTRYFIHSTKSHPITMFTSSFSHISGMHLLANMVALYSFGRVMHERMGREQFLAFYTSCGLLSSAGSHAVRAYRGDLTRSLGASGAIFGVAAGAAHNPDLKVSLIFLPFVSIPISVALPAMMVYDTVGLFKRWSTFDHAAHLSGAVFGYIAYSTSIRKLWPRRHQVLQLFGYPIK